MLSKRTRKNPEVDGPKQYAEIQQLWDEFGWCTLKDYLIYYNNLDVEPIRALEECSHWKDIKRQNIRKFSDL